MRNNYTNIQKANFQTLLLKIYASPLKKFEKCTFAQCLCVNYENANLWKHILRVRLVFICIGNYWLGMHNTAV